MFFWGKITRVGLKGRKSPDFRVFRITCKAVFSSKIAVFDVFLNYAYQETFFLGYGMFGYGVRGGML